MNDAESQAWSEYDSAADHQAKHHKLPDLLSTRVTELINEDPEAFEKHVSATRYAQEMATIASMDDLVSSVTAFDNWDDYQESLNRGYVPTFSRSNIEAMELGNRLQGYGYKVFYIQ